jgi:hypothetical protein
MKRTIFAVPLILAGCATHTWAPGPSVSSVDFEPTKARCSIMARNGGSGFAASGSASFVAGAALGAAIGNAIKANHDFNDCMEASGFLVADQTKEQQDRTAELKQQIKTYTDVGKECITNVQSDEKYSSIARHFPDPATGKFSMAQLADTSIPTTGEAQLVGEYYDDTTACRRQTIDGIVQVVPASSTAFEQQASDAESLTRKLIRREISWGDYIQSYDSSRTMLKTRLASIHF